MAVSFGQTGLVGEPEPQPPDSDYLHCVREPDVSIRIHTDAVDGIARDVMEGVKTLPKRGAEVGGLLMGTSPRGGGIDVSIERYQRLECEHRFGPQFALDEPELQRLESEAANIAAD